MLWTFITDVALWSLTGEMGEEPGNTPIPVNRLCKGWQLGVRHEQLTLFRKQDYMTPLLIGLEGGD
jgi:hypothetical protein